MKSAVCLCVRDDECAIVEWALHYVSIGFDRIIIYDDCSIDQTRSRALAVSRRVPCDVIDWRTNEEHRQVAAYNDCLRCFGPDFDWIAFFDCDEFLVREGGVGHISELLDQHESSSAIALNWTIFGSSGLNHRRRKTMMEAFLHRADLPFPPNRNIKSIVRPSRVTAACDNPHWFAVDGTYARIDGEPIRWDPDQMGLTLIEDIVHGAWRLHHYYTRGRNDWRRRLQRGQAGGTRLTFQAFHDHDRNEVRDLTAFPYAQRVRREAKRLGISPVVPQQGEVVRLRSA